MENLFSLKGKVALVTGASSGLGAQFAKALAGYGADVVLVARRMERLVALAAEIEALGVKCLPLQCDVTVESEVEAAVQKTIGEFDRLDILVNNAGVGLTEEFSLEEWSFALGLGRYSRQ